MIKDTSRRSSITANAPSPHENGVDSATPGSVGEASSNGPQPVADAINRTSSDTDAQRTSESQPMTASNSTSSNPSAIDLTLGAAAPYGTRSRNRNGISRPNYAEDKELDVEFELTTVGKDNSSGRKITRGAELDPINSDMGRAPNAARKNPSAEGDSTFSMQTHNKDPIPGTSTFSANPGANQSSKKRKATTQATTPTGPDSQLQVPSQGVSTPQAVTRRASMAAQVVAGVRDSNMLSFDACGCRLRGERLVADDGTILEVNGESYFGVDSRPLRSNLGYHS
jgi:hypothetical protein